MAAAQGDAARVPGKVGLQQRVLPDYRVAFFDRLALRCERGLSVFAGEARREEGIVRARGLERATYTPARNVHILSGRLYVCLQPGLLAWLRREQPDVLVVEANPRYLSNRAALDWMHERGRPVVGWGLGALETGAGRAWLRRRTLDRFDALIAYSSLGVSQYRAMGFPSERVHLAPNAAVPPPDRMPIRQPSTGRSRRLLFVGRLQRRKRVDALLEACAGLAGRAEVWVVGDGPARQELQDLAVQLRLEVRFWGDQRAEALQRLYDQADLFVLPGTGGLALQQALARGLPVIAAEGDGTQRDMVTAANGWQVSAETPGGLAEAVRQALAADDSRLHRMGQASFELARDRFNLDRMTDAFVEVLRAVTVRRR